MTRLGCAALLMFGLAAGPGLAQTAAGDGSATTATPPATIEGDDSAPDSAEQTEGKRTGMGASSMPSGERKEMDECTEFASSDYCKRQMDGP